jgi:hypothetical protein
MRILVDSLRLHRGEGATLGRSRTKRREEILDGVSHHLIDKFSIFYSYKDVK